MQREWGGTLGARYTMPHFALCLAAHSRQRTLALFMERGFLQEGHFVSSEARALYRR